MMTKIEGKATIQEAQEMNGSDGKTYVLLTLSILAKSDGWTHTAIVKINDESVLFGHVKGLKKGDQRYVEAEKYQQPTNRGVTGWSTSWVLLGIAST